MQRVRDLGILSPEWSVLITPLISSGEGQKDFKGQSDLWFLRKQHFLDSRAGAHPDSQTVTTCTRHTQALARQNPKKRVSGHRVPPHPRSCSWATAAGRRGVHFLQWSGPGHICRAPGELTNINHGFQWFFSYVFVVILRGKRTWNWGGFGRSWVNATEYDKN